MSDSRPCPRPGPEPSTQICVRRCLFATDETRSAPDEARHMNRTVRVSGLLVGDLGIALFVGGWLRLPCG